MGTLAQPQLFEGELDGNIGIFPSTRYQGSKNKILNWINRCTQDLEFNSVLDAFGGTGCVGYMYKKTGKRVLYNDLLRFNHQIGTALIENPSVNLTETDISSILQKQEGVEYPTFIFESFHDIYFTDEENRWLDVVVTNIRLLEDKYKRALALYALFQSCIIKRPYNLFHRRNLYIRTAEVERSFGNKKTWDTEFPEHFIKFAKEANGAVFDNGKRNKAYHSDILSLDIKADLVYIDTPYLSSKGAGVNYLDFYHFLEGLVFYEKWPDLIDNRSKHKKMHNGKSDWCDRNKIHEVFAQLFCKFKDSTLVISYRDDGIPTVPEFIEILKGCDKNKVQVKKLPYKYVLSKSSANEVLIIAE